MKLKKINTVNEKKNKAVTLGCSCTCTCYDEKAKMAAAGYGNQAVVYANNQK